MKFSKILFSAAAAALLASPGLAASEKDADSNLLKEATRNFQPLPKRMENANNPLTDLKIELGKMLYFDPRLSKSGSISCNSCHGISSYGVDNLPTSIGHGWTIGGRNAPTVMNAALHKTQFWDGRAADVEAQAKGPILNPKEMAMPADAAAVERIASIPAYVDLFKKVFPGSKSPVSYDNIAFAIAAYERTLVTPSRFDAYLGGDRKALTQDEKKGLRLFMDNGCAGCHNGVAIGGGEFQVFGIMKPYQELTKSKKIDLGRYDLTKKEEDKNSFKVPSLRNIANTYPYFHDGSVWSLSDAVKIMLETQTSQKLESGEIALITAFLGSLTGEIPKKALELPVLPPSTEKTSRPDAN